MIAQKIAERSRKKQKDKFETERNHHEILHLVQPEYFLIETEDYGPYNRF